MSLFGGLDMGSPAQRQEATVRKELELHLTHRPASGWGKVYPTGAHLLLKHGRFYPGRELPQEWTHLVGEVGECFWNAMRAAEEHPELRYCEGVTSVGGGRFLAHAWCLDADDHVLDFTWHGAVGQPDFQTRIAIQPHEYWGYFGVVIRPELARSVEDMPMLGRDPVAEMLPGMTVNADGQWISRTGLEVTPPESLPFLDVPYDPNRTEFT